MTSFDQRNQQVQTQYNAGRDINVYQPPLSLTEAQRKRNRSRMLERVQAIWIDGVLEPSVQGAAQIALELENKPNAVVTPLWHVLREYDKTGRLSSADVTIVQVYDHANGEVLILGEPGAGKSTLLLELTRHLLERARRDEAYPIPVVFNLSSWAQTRQPLAEWLASELATTYQVPRAQATSWIQTDQVLPLLDGLDEVAASHRGACVEALNTYRRAHGLLPTVVCCRQTDYLALPTRLLLRTAVVVQPLTSQQVESYLANGGERLEALHQALQEDADLQALATTPLMLNVLAVAYQGMPSEEIVTTGSPWSKREQIFATYVQRMLARRGISTCYTPTQTIHWLYWLAWQMKRHNQTEFYLERMQLDWLPKNLSYRLLPSIIMGVVYGLGVGLVFGFFFGLYPIPGPPLLFGLGCGALMGLLNWLLFILLNGVIFEVLGNREKQQKLEEIANSSEESRGHKLITFLGNRLVYGLFFGLLNGVLVGWLGAANHIFYESLQGGKDIVYLDPLSSGIIYGLINLLFIAIYFTVLGKLDIKIQPAEIWRWSWKSMRRNLARSLGSGLLFGLIYGVILGGPHNAWTSIFLLSPITPFYVVILGASHNAWTLQIPIGLDIGAGVGLTFAVISGLSHEMVSKQNIITPNQGIRNSFRNSILIGLITGLMTGIAIGLPQVLSSGLHLGLAIGLVVGLALGLNFWLRNGGTACNLHTLLRVCLWQANYAPLNYPRFLDFAVEHILLRRVGGGYIFIHRLLLDYFAAQETAPVLDEATEHRQTSTPAPVSPSNVPSEPTILAVLPDLSAPTISLAPPASLFEAPRSLPCGHELRTPGARFCTVCGASITMPHTPT